MYRGLSKGNSSFEGFKRRITILRLGGYHNLPFSWGFKIHIAFCGLNGLRWFENSGVDVALFLLNFSISNFRLRSWAIVVKLR